MLGTFARIARRTPGVAEWTARERRVLTATASSAGVAVVERRELTVTLHVDDARGRGSAGLRLAPHELPTLPDRLREAVARARASMGPSWRLPRPAAPAKVALDDPSLRDAPESAAAELFIQLRDALGPGGAVESAAGRAVRPRGARAEVELEDAMLRTSKGFRHAYRGTLARLALAVVADEAQPVMLSLERRRRRDLALERELAPRLERSSLASPAELSPGRYDIVLAGHVLAERYGARFGLFDAFATHADAARERRGIARYAIGERLTDADRHLTLHSDGARAFGIGSRPCGADGAPTRRFALVVDGVARGLALDQREAALRGVAANGGVRDLVVAPGTASAAELATPRERPLVVVSSLDLVTIDGERDALSARLIGARIRPNAAPSACTARLRGDATGLLSRGRASRELADAGWLLHPRALRIDDVELL